MAEKDFRKLGLHRGDSGGGAGVSREGGEGSRSAGLLNIRVAQTRRESGNLRVRLRGCYRNVSHSSVTVPDDIAHLG